MGGSERFVSNLSALQSSEFDVHIHTTTGSIRNAGTTSTNGITFHRYYSPATVWNINPLSFMLRGLMRSDSALFHIHSYLYLSSNQAMLAKILKKKKSILQIHGGIGLPPYPTSLSKTVVKQFYDKTLGSFTVNHSDIVASVSRTDLDHIAQRYGISESRLRYLQNAVDTEVFIPKKKRNESNRKTVLYLGDFEPWKGVGLLVRWLNQKAAWDGFEVRFRFVGQGSLRPHLVALQQQLRIYENSTSIEVLGPRQHHEIPSILQEADILVLPSYWEGMPTVILESMAAGVPVISTRVGDIPRIIRNGEDGILISRSEKSFRSAIQLLLNDHGLARRISNNARHLVSKYFSLPMMGRTAARIYADLLG
ncbi:MAG: glycosyltransferase family 4 protein [Candidatus Thorarchaeota archaeon]